MEREKPCAGQFYRHFKGKLYQIIGCARDADTLEENVVYQALYGEYLWYVRPLSEFLSPVDGEKYPEHRGKWRFEKTSPVEQEVSMPLSQMEVPMREILPQITDESEESGIQPELLRFLDAKTAGEKLQVLHEIRRHVDENLLTNMELSLDIMSDERETPERRLELIERNLEKRVKYEGGRLR